MRVLLFHFAMLMVAGLALGHVPRHILRQIQKSDEQPYDEPPTGWCGTWMYGTKSMPKSMEVMCEPGYCCSVTNYCGSTEKYCGKGCQSEFGWCKGRAIEDPTVPPASSTKSSTSNEASTESSTATSIEASTNVVKTSIVSAVSTLTISSSTESSTESSTATSTAASTNVDKTSVTPSTVGVVPVFEYAYVGCLAYPMNLHVDFTVVPVEGELTNRKCASACQTSNSLYRFASTREGKECLCSEQHGGQDPNSAEDCSYPCPGDASQKCGGDGFLMTMNLAPGWARYGCYKDESSSTKMKLISDGPYMSSGRCTAACKKAGFSVAGTKLGVECYCGDDISDGLMVNQELCNMSCHGASETNCGGKDAYDVWKEMV